MTHLLGTSEIWAHFGVSGSPTFVTITAEGEIDHRIGNVTRELLDGVWASG